MLFRTKLLLLLFKCILLILFRGNYILVIRKVPVDDKSFYIEISEKDALKAVAVETKFTPEFEQIMEFKEVEIKENISAIVKNFHNSLDIIKPDKLDRIYY